jgi:hypothetical protein
MSFGINLNGENWLQIIVIEKNRRKKATRGIEKKRSTYSSAGNISVLMIEVV